MRSIFMRALAIIAVVLAGACSPAPERARHTVDEYRADEGLRDQQLALCQNDTGTLGHTPDCINAKEAARREDRRSLRDLPTVRLPPPTGQKASEPAAAATSDRPVEGESR